MMRVKNEKIVNPPWLALIDIINSHTYCKGFKNSLIKRHVWSRVTQFLLESFDRIPASLDQSLFNSLLLTLSNEDLPYNEKCHFFLLLIQRLNSSYGKPLPSPTQGGGAGATSNLDTAATLIEPIFLDDVRQSFLQMALYYMIYHLPMQVIQPSLILSFQEANLRMMEKYKGAIKETDG
jgi:hypothetical protein